MHLCPQNTNQYSCISIDQTSVETVLYCEVNAYIVLQKFKSLSFFCPDFTEMTQNT